MFTVYILKSLEFEGKTYIGFTSDIKSRLIAHNHPQNKGWTKRYQPWGILHVESYGTKKEAIAREKYFKSGVGRRYIQNLL